MVCRSSKNTADAVNRPQVEHASSRSSVAASEDFQSATSGPSRPSTGESDEPLFQQPRVTSETQQPRIQRKPVPSQSASPSSSSNGKISETLNRQTTMNDARNVQNESPDVDQSPYILFALDQLTRDEEVRGSRAYPTGDRWSTASYTAPLLPPTAPTLPQIQSSASTTDQTPTKARVKVPAHVLAGRRYSETDVDDRLKAIVPFDAAALDFVPAILRPIWLGLFVLVTVLLCAGLLYSGISSGTVAGLWAYTTFGGQRYFVFQYLPTMTGMFMLLWLFQIQIAIQRIAPFIGLASTQPRLRTEAPLLNMLTTNFLLPHISYAKAGQPFLAAIMFVYWLQIFTIPLFSSLYNVYFYGSPQDGQWRWMTVQGCVWTIFALYVLQALATLALIGWFWNKKTGLRWDPRSLADLVVLLDSSNARSGYVGTDNFTRKADFRSRERADRVGYWTSERLTGPFYALGEEGRPHSDKIRDSALQEKSSNHGSINSYASVRYRHLPWFLNTGVALFWIAAGLVLYITFLIVSYVNNAVLDGFRPLLPVAPDSEGFSSTNFFYSFIPSTIGHLIFLCWYSVDLAFRRLQPYKSLSAADGEVADRSLLLDYVARFPGSVTMSAVSNGHWRTAWISFVTLITASFPILAGGCFWAQFYIPDQQVRVAVHPQAYYALCALLGVFAITLPLLAIRMHSRRLPHGCTTFAEQVSWLYASNMIGEQHWRGQSSSKADLVSRMLSNAKHTEPPRYHFGYLADNAGQSRIGISRLDVAQQSPQEKQSFAPTNDTITQPPPVLTPPRHPGRLSMSAQNTTNTRNP